MLCSIQTQAGEWLSTCKCVNVCVCICVFIMVSIENPLKRGLEDDCFTEIKNDSTCDFLRIGLLFGKSLLSKDGPTEEKCALSKLPYDYGTLFRFGKWHS